MREAFRRASGLGKTLTTLMYCRALAGTIEFAWRADAFSSGGLLGVKTRKIVVACPATLVGNWAREFKKVREDSA